MLLKRPASQSSTWTHNNNGNPVPGSATNANDGVLFTEYDKDPRHCSHTDNQDNPWWSGDLGSSRYVSSVKVIGRTDCCQERMNGY